MNIHNPQDEGSKPKGFPSMGFIAAIAVLALVYTLFSTNYDALEARFGTNVIEASYDTTEVASVKKLIVPRFMITVDTARHGNHAYNLMVTDSTGNILENIDGRPSRKAGHSNTNFVPAFEAWSDSVSYPDAYNVVVEFADGERFKKVVKWDDFEQTNNSSHREDWIAEAVVIN